ncbi:MAG: L-threonylcarbamoyladenylate synthase [Alphaproteobacteria bacterium]|nr:L-threonylcarbamoyladenylate synthase [Alphaproteobacteria bacterium]
MPRILPLTAESLAVAGQEIRAGRLVAFPTETVYGLGGDATNGSAIAAIFEAKGRPRFNPLIVHLPDVGAARAMGRFNEMAELLAARFWPGPLTLVVPRRPEAGLSDLVSAGLGTVALRVPAHEGARALLLAAERPLAAPSANRSGRVSPTTAQHVADELGDAVALILDGGSCPVGVESTVVDVSGDTPLLLRPGGVPLEDIEAALGRSVPVAGVGDAIRAPGMLESHYAPGLPLRLEANHANPGEALLGFGPAHEATLNLSETGDLREAAANLFAHLRALDRPGFTGIAVMPIPEAGLGRAINDRLRRAAAPRGQPA